MQRCSRLWEEKKFKDLFKKKFWSVHCRLGADATLTVTFVSKGAILWPFPVALDATQGCVSVTELKKKTFSSLLPQDVQRNINRNPWDGTSGVLEKKISRYFFSFTLSQKIAFEKKSSLGVNVSNSLSLSISIGCWRLLTIMPACC